MILADSVAQPFAVVGLVFVGAWVLFLLVSALVAAVTGNTYAAIDVRGKRVLVTGGSAGIGLETAKCFAARGARVVITARREDVLKGAVAEINAHAHKLLGAQAAEAQYVVMDVSDEGNVVAGVTAALHGWGDRVVAPPKSPRRRSMGAKEMLLPANGDGVDVLVCCAGFSHPSRFLDCPVAEARRMMEVNYFGAVNVVRAVLPLMYDRCRRAPAAGPCRIVLVSSMAAWAPVAGFTHYAPTKAAMVALASSLDMESAGRGVRVQVVIPPDVETPGYAEENKVKSEECRRICAMGGASPFKASDMGRAVVDAVTGGSSFAVSLGTDGWLLGHVCAGLQTRTPVGVFLEAAGLLSIGRLIGAVISKLHYGIVLAVVREEKAKARTS